LKELANLVTNVVATIKILPVSAEMAHEHKHLREQTEDTAKRLKHLEEVEGVHSVDINKEKINISAHLTKLNKSLGALLIKTPFAESGDREVVSKDETPFENLKNFIKKYKGEHPAASWNLLESFLQFVHQRYSKILAIDEKFMESSLLESSADTFESLELHLKKILEQMLLLRKRLFKLKELKSNAPIISELGMTSLVISMDKELEATFQSDIQSMKDLCKDLDQAETAVDAFLTSMSSERKLNNTLTSDEKKFAGQLLQFIIKIRDLQHEVEECVPETVEEGGGGGGGGGDPKKPK
jgi:hypothetical protein